MMMKMMASSILALSVFMVYSLLPTTGFICTSLSSSSLLTPRSSISRPPPARQQQLYGVRSLKATLPAGISGAEKLEKLFKDSELLGPVRFVSMTEGAIIETVGSWDNLRFNDLPKGRYATVSDEDNTFEVHIKVDNVAGVKMLTMPTKDGKKTLYVTRITDKKGDTIISAMLHSSSDGEYEEGAVDYWEKLRDVFGEEWSVQ